MIRESFRSVTCILLPLYARHVSGLPHWFSINPLWQFAFHGGAGA